MRRFVKISGFAVVIALGMSSEASAATTFDFLFDNSGSGGADGTIGTPIVGGGTFISPVDLGVGLYALSSLPGFSVQFTFGSEIFATSDIATPISEVAVSITQVGSQERLVFTENGTPADGGPFGGALDLVNAAADDLSFAPSSIGGNLYQESGVNQYLGNYLALSQAPTTGVPEPATWAMMLLGFGGLGALMRGARRKLAGAAAAA
jgi:hypothetical protein